MVTTANIATNVQDAISEIPASVDSGTNIQDWIEKAAITVENYTGSAINNNDVVENCQAILFNLGCAYTLSKMISVGVNFDVSLGEFKVSKGTRETPQSRQMKHHLDMATRDLKMVGSKIGNLYAKVNG